MMQFRLSLQPLQRQLLRLAARCKSICLCIYVYRYRYRYIEIGIEMDTYIYICTHRVGRFSMLLVILDGLLPALFSRSSQLLHPPFPWLAGICGNSRRSTSVSAAQQQIRVPYGRGMSRRCQLPLPRFGYMEGSKKPSPNIDPE